LTAADIAQMPHESATLTQDGQTKKYEGVLLYDLLSKVGVPFGKAMTGKPMASYLLLTGRDGYQVVFALPELDPQFEVQRFFWPTRAMVDHYPQKSNRCG